MPYFRAKAGMAYALPAGMGSAEAVRLSINRNARTRKPQISEDASHDILHIFDDEPQSNIPPPLLDEKKQPDSKIPQPREREEARADLPSWPHRIIRYRPKTERRLLYNAPIENRSLFSVKKRAPNPQIPEPGRMLLPSKIRMQEFSYSHEKNFFIHGSGTGSLPAIEPFLPCWHLRRWPRMPELPNSLFGIAGSELQIMSEMLDLTMVCRRVGKVLLSPNGVATKFALPQSSKEKSRKRILGEWI